MLRALVVGSQGGLGELVSQRLDEIGYEVDEMVEDDPRNPSVREPNEILEYETGTTPLHAIVQCQGVNMLRRLEELKINEFQYVMNNNAMSLWRIVQRCLPGLILGRGVVCNVVSNAANIPMTHSLAYNASKAAAAMITRQMAHEVGRANGITIFGINPNKLEGTSMSTEIEDAVCELRGWTPEQAREYQLAALPAGEETTPDRLAHFIGYLLSEEYNYKYLQGTILPYGGPM